MSNHEHHLVTKVGTVYRTVVLAEHYDALKAELDALKAAPVQGEAALDERKLAFEACPESNCDWGAFYLGWKARAALSTPPQPAEVGELVRAALPQKKDTAAGFDGQRTYALGWNAAIDAALAKLEGK